ncbi:magnesium-translocating P-type ATPase [Candidatus Collierbacteria bacterium]|nr:magnesium-translocating P-type ATPase [Candidatus Collierbacteria bacterium]
MGFDQYSSLPIEKIFQDLRTSKNGLADGEAKSRLVKYGPNIISGKKELNVILEFLSHFKSPLIIILIFAAIVSGYFREIADSVIVGIMVLASVILDFLEEHSANHAAEKLKEKVGNTATVIRQGNKVEIKNSEICPGDIIFLSSGDLIPADARVIEADDFFVNQSALTGESFPREKIPGTEKDGGNRVIPDNILCLGANVISGTALAVVFSTGKNTEFGKIAQSLTGKDAKSEFEIGLSSFGFFITKIILFLVLFIFLFNSLINKDILGSFMFAVAIAVGVTPELLPMIMSITMARGSQRMAKLGVIVKRLSSIPNLGGMDILSADKTGTLTEDKIRLVTYTDIYGNHNENVFLQTYLNSFYQTGVKNPLDKAVLDYKKTDIGKYKKIEEIPFDFKRKMMSVAVDGVNGKVLITKGAPEEILERCAYYRKLNKKELLNDTRKREAMGYYRKLSLDGFRVLAVAVKSGLPAKNKYTHADEDRLELLGFVSFLDPAKSDVKEVIKEIEKRGVEIKILTGDNELVTEKICRDIGLNIKGVMLGAEMETLSDDALRIRAEETTIFARFSPDEKNRILTILKSNNHVVGYLGDGINDAPALKNADVGISVNTAVDVAKESADIILTHKSLRAIVGGMLEGRRSFGNTMKYVMMGLSSNFGNMFSVAGAIFYIPFLPMLPLQILLNNLIYDFSQITIPSDKVDNDWIDRPGKLDMAFIKKFMYIFGPVSSIFDFLTFFILFSVFKVNQSVFQTGWFMESLATQTLVIHIIRTKQIPFLQSRAGNFLLLSTFSVVIIGWLIPFSPLAKFFKFSPLPTNILLIIAGLVVCYLVLVEIIKRIFYRQNPYWSPVRKPEII